MEKVILRRLHLALTVLCMILLTSCSTRVAKKDGPPNFYVDETRVPNAVPKPEKLAKYGNMPSYRVFGKRYYTMRSSKHYDVVGTASWYGTQFHERNTSSGEPYDMLGMTAAHKTLPLPTYVEVTNLANQRKIIVKVNDRGPFASDRILDLSYVAAKKLGMLGHGTARVRVKAIDPYRYGQEFELAKNTRKSPRSMPSFAKTKPALSSRFVYLQAGAFRNKVHAQKLKERLSTLISAPVRISRGKFYRVEIGPFRDVASANKMTSKLLKWGIKSNKLHVPA